MKHLNKTRAIAAAIHLDGGDMFSGRPVRASRAIPRRDENGHEKDGGKTGGDDKGGDDGKKPDDKGGDGGDDGKPKEDPKPVDVTKTKAFKDEKKRADDAEAELQQLREKGMSEDEKTREAETKTRVSKAVADKETELTDHYEGIVSGLQDQIIDSTIDAVFAGSPLDRKDYEDVIGTLDKTLFIKDDGSVDREKVKKTLAPITKAATSRPPRTSGGRQAQDNGFGRYLKQQDD